MSYRLTRKAEDDIIEIYQIGHENWGEEQADRYHESLSNLFELIALNPQMARLRNEIDPPVRVHPFGSHIVIYQIKDHDVIIIRIRHSREDWVSELVERHEQ